MHKRDTAENSRCFFILYTVVILYETQARRSIKFFVPCEIHRLVPQNDKRTGDS